MDTYSKIWPSILVSIINKCLDITINVVLEMSNRILSLSDSRVVVKSFEYARDKPVY